MELNERRVGDIDDAVAVHVAEVIGSGLDSGLRIGGLRIGGLHSGLRCGGSLGGLRCGRRLGGLLSGGCCGSGRNSSGSFGRLLGSGSRRSLNREIGNEGAVAEVDPALGFVIFGIAPGMAVHGLGVGNLELLVLGNGVERAVGVARAGAELDRRVGLVDAVLGGGSRSCGNSGSGSRSGLRGGGSHGSGSLSGLRGSGNRSGGFLTLGHIGSGDLDHGGSAGGLNELGSAGVFP